jgi:hypothetical protein
VDVLRVVSVADTVIAFVPIVDVGQILWKRLAAVAQPDSVHGWDRPFWVIRHWNREAAMRASTSQDSFRQRWLRPVERVANIREAMSHANRVRLAGPALCKAPLFNRTEFGCSCPYPHVVAGERELDYSALLIPA